MPDDVQVPGQPNNDTGTPASPAEPNQPNAGNNQPAGHGGDTPGNGTANAPAQPVEYEPFKAPEGVELDSGLIDKFVPIAKELGVSQQGAQRLVDLFADVRKNEAEAIQANITRQNQEWVEAVKSDKTLGGDNFEKSTAVARRAIEMFGTPELKEVLDYTGLGNHPEVVRVFHAIGLKISEDGVFGGSGDSSGEEDIAKRLYPSHS